MMLPLPGMKRMVNILSKGKKTRRNNSFDLLELAVVALSLFLWSQDVSLNHILIADMAFVALLVILKIIFIIFKRHRLKISGIKKIDSMSGIEFEQYLQMNLKRNGFSHIKTTKASGDFGADITMRDGDGNLVIVQAKRYKSKVGIAAVQQVIGAMSYYNGDYGIVITNSYFTPAAVKLAEASSIELWDRDTLIDRFKL